MDYTILLTVSCISFIILLLFYSGRIKRPKTEHFLNNDAKNVENVEGVKNKNKNDVMIAAGINNFLIDREAVEICDILEYDNYMDPNMSNSAEESDIYTTMRNILDSGRIKRYKPKDRTDFDKNKEYCFIYDDPINDLQDTMMLGKDCNINNPQFANNPMISKVFVDTKQDNVYKLPYRKCVLEIDKKNVNRDNLVKFYKYHTGKMTCDDKILAIINKLDKKTREYVDLYERYRRKKQENIELNANYDKILAELRACIIEMKKLKKELDDLIIDKEKNQTIFDKNKSDLKTCKGKLKETSEIRDLDITQTTKKRDDVKEELATVNEKVKTCNDELNKNTPEAERYKHIYDESGIGQRKARDDGIKFAKRLEKCMGEKKIQEERWEDMRKKNEGCFPYIFNAADCKINKTQCDIDLEKCIINRDDIFDKKENERKKYEKCSKEYPPKKEKRDTCNKHLNVVVEDNKKKTPIISENKEIITGLWKDVKQCNIDLGRINVEIEVMQQNNTDLYNELSKTNKQCADDTVENINTQIEQVKLDNTLKKEELRKEKVKETTTDCKLGMFNCLKGNASNFSQHVIDNAGGRTEDAQYCAEACAKDSRCRAIFFNEGEKRCFKLSKPFETTNTEGIVRTIDEDILGYTANFDGNTRSTDCPLGAMNCMNAVGISTKDKVVVDEKPANNFGQCVETCQKTENCRSVSYSLDTSTCKMFNNFFSEHNENKEPVRYTDNKYISADIDTSLCLSMEWSEWGPCVGTEFCTGKGVSERTKGGGGAGCPEEKMYRPCDIAFKRTELEVEKWSACSVKCGPGPGTKTKFKNRCNDDVITDSCEGAPFIRPESEVNRWLPCTTNCGVGVNRKFNDRCSAEPSQTRECVRNFELWVHEDDWFKKGQRSYNCSQMEYLGDNMYQAPMNSAGFGMSSFRFQKNPRGFKSTQGNLQAGWKGEDDGLDPYRNFEATDLGDVNYGRSVVWLPAENLNN